MAEHEMIIRVKVSDDIDPTTIDPEDIAADVIDTFTDDLRHRISTDIGGVKLLGAEWVAEWDKADTVAKAEARRLRGVLHNHPRSEHVRMARGPAEFVIAALLGEK
jgi:hypothetical protein